MQKYLLVILCYLAVGLSGCEKEGEVEDNPDSIYYKLQADGRFTGFLLKIDEAGLAPRLKSNEEFTVFAVADGAATHEYDIRWHIVEGRYNEESLIQTEELVAINSQTININAETYTLYAEWREITELDIEGSNGVIHIVVKHFDLLPYVPVLPTLELVEQGKIGALIKIIESKQNYVAISAAISDEGKSENVFEAYDLHQQNAGSPLIYETYVNYYVGLRRVDEIQNALDNLRLPEEDKAMHRAEANTIAAFTYLQMVQAWGKIIYLPPLNSSDYNPARNSVPEVLDSLTRLLEPSIPHLLSNPDHPRPSKWAAMATLAEVYLLQEEWSSALSLLDDIVANSSLEISPTINSGFELENLAWAFARGSQDNLPIADLLSQNYVTADPTLLQKYEANDSRATTWYSGNSVMRYANTSFYPLVSFAKVKLMYAEALARTGNLTEAIAQVNELRNRAGASIYDISNLNLEAVLEKILLECQLELSFEGERYNALRRFDKFVETMSKESNNVDQKDLLLPIPSKEVQSGVEQNPGY